MVARTLAFALAVIAWEPAHEPLHGAPPGGIVWEGGNGRTTLNGSLVARASRKSTTRSSRLDLPGMKCTVSMLANDWSRTPRAHAVEQALGTVSEKARTSDAP